MTRISNIKIELDSQRTKVIPQRKLLLAEKLECLLDEYDTCLVIEITNVGSKQIGEMRKRLGDKARFLFGKNTLMRKVIRDYVKRSKNSKLMQLMDLIKGNCGLVFVENEKMKEIRKELLTTTKKACAARVGAVAPIDVFIPVGPTNLEPTKTWMFQDMNIGTRINRGQIDVVSEQHIIRKGEKVGASEASLLSQLNIKPFCYGVSVESIYEKGEVIKDASFMDMSMDEIAEAFYGGLHQIAALCFTMNQRQTTMLNIPHSILNAYKQTLGISTMLNKYSWDGLDAIQNILEYAQMDNHAESEVIDDEDTGQQSDNNTEPDNDVNIFDPFSSDDDTSSSSSSSEDN